MSVRDILFSAGANSEKVYADDVFSAYTYQGDSNSKRVIVNNLDLTKGGMVWIKTRSTTWDPVIFDSASGIDKCLFPNGQGAKNPSAALTSLNSNGFTLNANWAINDSAYSYVAWAFRKAVRFFDIQTYTGNGNAGRRAIPHGLACTPGMVVYKCTSANSEWKIWHRSLVPTNGLNFSSPAPGSGVFPAIAVDASNLYLETSSSDLNSNGASYVAYIFAHDSSADGQIQCGTFATDSGAQATVTLGFEPQYLAVKRIDTTGAWRIVDVSRGMNAPGEPAGNALGTDGGGEAVNGHYHPFATGFTDGGSVAANATFVYMAIRRPNKAPTNGSQVYSAGGSRSGINGTSVLTSAQFPPDLHLCVDSGGNGPSFGTRLIGKDRLLQTNTNNQEYAYTPVWEPSMNGASVSFSGLVNYSGHLYYDYFFKRAPGFMDIVCVTGNPKSATTAHSLGVTPELVIFKNRTGVTLNWLVWLPTLFPGKTLYLNTTGAIATSASTLTASATNATFNNFGNNPGEKAVAYLLSSLSGISKVGSYTGNGASQTINCGFAAGARFVLIKRTDAAGDWYVWDTVRGIVAANDPHFSLNTGAGDVTTDDSLDPQASGFIVNQVAATNINLVGGTYLYWAIA